MRCRLAGRLESYTRRPRSANRYPHSWAADRGGEGVAGRICAIAEAPSSQTFRGICQFMGNKRHPNRALTL